MVTSLFSSFKRLPCGTAAPKYRFEALRCNLNKVVDGYLYRLTLIEKKIIDFHARDQNEKDERNVGIISAQIAWGLQMASC